MQVRLSGFAEADLDHIHAYTTARHPAAATRLIDELLRHAFRLATFPQMGRPGRIDGTCEFSIPDTPYFLVYTLSADSVDIERILHSRRQYPPVD